MPKGVRLNPKHDERTRAAIQTTQLVKRLQSFALGVPDDAGNEVDMDANRLRAVEILLRKTLPDLSSIQVGGDQDNPINIISRIERVIVDPNG